VPAISVTAVDTVAAGDAFNGGLAAALVEGLSPYRRLFGVRQLQGRGDRNRGRSLR